MAYIVNCLLACALVLTSTMIVSSYRPVPMFGIEAQCQARGPYDGACISQNSDNGELTCLRLACAERQKDGSYQAVDTGRVENGTLCAHNKVCVKGACITINPDRIPIALMNEAHFDCSSPLPVKRFCRRPIRVHPASSSSRDTASTSRDGRGSPTDRRRH